MKNDLVDKYNEYIKNQSHYSINIIVNEDKPKSVADKYVLDHYGNFCSLGDEYSIENKTIFPIIADMPIGIDDDNKTSFKWINVGQIGEIKIKRNENQLLFVDTAPDYRVIIKNMRNKYFQFRDNLENELIKASEFRFAKIDDIKGMMKPASLLIKRFSESLNHEIPKGVSYKDILLYDNRERWIEYLINSNLVTRKKTVEGRMVFPTDQMQIYFNESLNSKEYSFEELCLGKIILHNQKEILRYNPMFKSYLKLTNSLYQASFERGKLLEVTSNTWINRLFARRYRKPNDRLKERFRLIYTNELKKSRLVDERTTGIFSPKIDVYKNYEQGIKQNIAEKFPFTLDFWSSEIVG